jgi:hypothetical protein
MAYKAELPEGVSLPPGFKVDEADPRYKALHDLATREKLSQSAFSQILGVEAQRVNADYEHAARAAAPAPAPAPAKPGVPENWGKMSFQQKMNWSHNNPKRG